MDASGKEVTLWQSVVERAGLWVEGSVPLRTAMERPSGEWNGDATGTSKQNISSPRRVNPSQLRHAETSGHDKIRL
jgi:hypothetical protein